MPPLPSEVYFGEIAASTAELAVLVDCTDPALPIPTCPGWTLRQLATHVGRGHRWVAEIAATRSQEIMEFAAVPDGQYPDKPGECGRWLTAGAGRLVGALSEAGCDQVWAFGEIVPASFWARRMSHETVVHRADAQLAAGDEATIIAELAADAIDEWLTVLTGPMYGQPDMRELALARGTSLHVQSTDPELGRTGQWLVEHTQDGVRVRTAHARQPAAGSPRPAANGGRATADRAEVAIRGEASALLMVLLGRRPITDSAISVFGDTHVLGQWLTRTPF